MFFSVKRVMLGSLSKCFIVSFFLELLEFSEDRHPWESVEEKLNAIRYGLLAVLVVRPSIPSSVPLLIVPTRLLSSLPLFLPPSPFFSSFLAPVFIPPSSPPCFPPTSVPQSLPHYRRLFLCPCHFPVSACLLSFVSRFPRRFLPL